MICNQSQKDTRSKFSIFNAHHTHESRIGCALKENYIPDALRDSTAISHHGTYIYMERLCVYTCVCLCILSFLLLMCADLNP